MDHERPSEADHEDELPRPAGSLYRRRAEIEERIVELRARAVVAMEGSPRGLALEHAVNALVHSERAREHLRCAYAHAAQTHRLAAAAHDRFADHLDKAMQPARADSHRQAASNERAASDRDELSADRIAAG